MKQEMEMLLSFMLLETELQQQTWTDCPSSGPWAPLEVDPAMFRAEIETAQADEELLHFSRQ